MTLLEDFRGSFAGCSTVDGGQWRAISQSARTRVYKTLIIRYGAQTVSRHVDAVVAVLDRAECEAATLVHNMWARRAKGAL